MRLIVGVLISLLILNGCASYDLRPYETDGIDISVERGKEIMSDKKNNIQVSLLLSNDDQYYRHSVLIENYTLKDIFLNDADIRLYQGNIEKNNWQEIPIFAAEYYYDKVEKEKNFMLFLLAFSAALSSVDAGYSYSNTSGSFRSYSSNISGTYSANTRTYNPAVAQIQRMATQQQLTSYVNSSEAELHDLEESLLYSSDIDSNSSYWGVVFSPKADGPDFKFVITVENEKYEFFYYRDDREEIINPFIDKDRKQYVIYYSFSQKNELGIGYGTFYPTKTGYSISLGCHLPDYQSYRFSSLEYVDDSGEVQGGYGEYIFTGDEVQFSTEASVRINTKIAPYIWVNGGVGISYLKDFLLADHYSIFGDFYDTRWITKEFAISVAPKLGIDVLYGPFFFSGGAFVGDSWNIGYEFSGGISF